MVLMILGIGHDSGKDSRGKICAEIIGNGSGWGCMEEDDCLKELLFVGSQG